MAKLYQFTGGGKKVVDTVSASTGAADAGKVPHLNNAGKIDDSLRSPYDFISRPIGSQPWTYTYLPDGSPQSRTNGSVTVTFVYQNGYLVQAHDGVRKIDFVYSADGNLVQRIPGLL
jgi:hypothetical protein